MANSVSNDALWEKLSEISQQLKGSKPADNTPDFSGLKDEIFTELKRQTTKLGKHYDVNFKANQDNWTVMDVNVTKIWNTVSRIRKQQRETAQRQTEIDTAKRSEVLVTPVKGSQEYFNFRFFKLRKTSVVITILSLLVFILILFCMKQQNDYALLINEYHRLGNQHTAR